MQHHVAPGSQHRTTGTGLLRLAGADRLAQREHGSGQIEVPRLPRPASSGTAGHRLRSHAEPPRVSLRRTWGGRSLSSGTHLERAIAPWTVCGRTPSGCKKRVGSAEHAMKNPAEMPRALGIIAGGGELPAKVAAAAAAAGRNVFILGLGGVRGPGDPGRPGRTNSSASARPDASSPRCASTAARTL